MGKHPQQALFAHHILFILILGWLFLALVAWMLDFRSLKDFRFFVELKHSLTADLFVTVFLLGLSCSLLFLIIVAASTCSKLWDNILELILVDKT